MKKLGLILFATFCICAETRAQFTLFFPPAGGGVTNTGTAAVGDVATGKTFSSSALTNATGTSTKDATVGGSASIEPPQAFVDCWQIDIGDALVDTDLVDWHSKGITSIDPDLVGNLDILHGAAAGQVGLHINLAGNAIPQSQVNGILAALVTNGNTGGSVNLSGGTTGAPTPIILKIQFPDIDFATLGDGETFGTVGNGNDALFVCQKLAVATSDPPLSSDGGHIHTGTGLDPVTRQQIINAMVANGQGHVVDNGDGSINLTITNGTFYPYDLSDGDPGTGLSATVVQSGNPGVQSVGTLVVTNDWTVTTN